MHRRRWALNWLAVLAVLLYGLAPAFSALLPHPSVPLACATEAAHACACRPDPHGTQDCCCKHGDTGARCKASRLPCDRGDSTEALASAIRSPMQLPQRVAPAVSSPLCSTAFTAIEAMLRLSPPVILTPPPRA